MAGHSKWANIQHRKGRQDARKGKLFSKLIRELTVAARSGGGPDPGSNPRLRAAMDAAFTANMSKDTIERAIKRAAGPGEGAGVEEIRYEGYGPGGVAVMVDAMTDNRNRTVAEVRHAFSKCGGNLGTGGSVAYLFSKAGSLAFPAGTDESRLLELALEAGAEDVVSNEDGTFEVVTAPDALVEIKERLIASALTPDSAEVTMRASTNQTLGLEHAEGMVKLLEMLEELDDVQRVYSNADIPDQILEQIGG